MEGNELFKPDEGIEKEVKQFANDKKFDQAKWTSAWNTALAVEDHEAEELLSNEWDIAHPDYYFNQLDDETKQGILDYLSRWVAQGSGEPLSDDEIRMYKEDNASDLLWSKYEERTNSGEYARKKEFEISDLKVLVVEDNEKNLQTMKKHFSKYYQGYYVDYAEDFECAQQMLEKNKYDLVISDLFFPEKKGSGIKSKGNKLVNRISGDLYREREEINREFGHKHEIYTRGLIEKLVSKSKLEEAYSPMGAYIVETCVNGKIPCEIFSSESGHGSLGLPVLMYLQEIKKFGDTEYQNKDCDKSNIFELRRNFMDALNDFGEVIVRNREKVNKNK